MKLDWFEIISSIVFGVLVCIIIALVGLFVYTLLIYPNTEEAQAQLRYRQELKAKCLEGDMGACTIYEVEYGKSGGTTTVPIYVPIKF